VRQLPVRRREVGLAGGGLYDVQRLLVGGAVHRRETQPDPGSFAAQYGQYGCLADLLRQIGHDERTHKQGSLTNMRTSRLSSTL
jgi:hypothetical protein